MPPREKQIPPRGGVRGDKERSRGSGVLLGHSVSPAGRRPGSKPFGGAKPGLSLPGLISGALPLDYRLRRLGSRGRISVPVNDLPSASVRSENGRDAKTDRRNFIASADLRLVPLHLHEVRELRRDRLR